LPRLGPTQIYNARVYNFFKLVMTKSVYSNLYPATDENVFGDEVGQRSNRMLKEMYTNLQKYAPDDDDYYRRAVDMITMDREYILEVPERIVEETAAPLWGSVDQARSKSVS